MMAFSSSATMPIQPPINPGLPLRPRRHKRKADETQLQDVNERLRKRMARLDLVRNEHYVPVEGPPPTTATSLETPSSIANNPTTALPEEPMQLDDTKHKVYIYNLDDELSSSTDSESEPDPGRLVLLHPELVALRATNRLHIPRPIPLPRRNSVDDGQAVVLYQPDGPPSLSVPAEQDGVRRAIVAARERVRERQALERSNEAAIRANATAGASAARRAGKMSFATPVKFPRPMDGDAEAEMMLDGEAGAQSSSSAAAGIVDELDAGYDPDAMDID